MNTHKENIVKGHCFKAAIGLYSSTLKDVNASYISDADIDNIYSLSIRLFNSGKSRYWKSAYEERETEHKDSFFKRLFSKLKKKEE